MSALPSGSVKNAMWQTPGVEDSPPNSTPAALELGASPPRHRGRGARSSRGSAPSNSWPMSARVDQVEADVLAELELGPRAVRRRSAGARACRGRTPVDRSRSRDVHGDEVGALDDHRRLARLAAARSGGEACSAFPSGSAKTRHVADAGVEDLALELDALPPRARPAPRRRRRRCIAMCAVVCGANSIAELRRSRRSTEARLADPELAFAGRVGPQAERLAVELVAIASRSVDGNGDEVDAPSTGDQPTEPSIWSWISRFISTAYSSGSSLVIGSTKPETIIARRLRLGEPARHQVEELLLADLRDRRLVADVDVVLVDLDVRVGVGARLLVEDQRVADDLRLRAVRALRPTSSRPR